MKIAHFKIYTKAGVHTVGVELGIAVNTDEAFTAMMQAWIKGKYMKFGDLVVPWKKVNFITYKVEEK